MTTAPPPPPYYQPRPKPYDIGEALGWGWRKFLEHKTVFIVGMLPMLVVIIGFYTAYFVLYLDLFLNGDDMTDAEAGDLFMWVGVAAGVLLLLMVPISVLQANLIRVALVVADGGRPTLSMLYSTKRVGRILVTTITLGAATFVGMLLCYLPGLAFAAFAFYTLPFVLDQDMRPIQAIKASFALVRSHLGISLLTVLVVSIIGSLGTYACVIGIVASVPIALLAQVYCYRALILGTVRP